MKIKFEFQKRELWIESDNHQFIVHEGFEICEKVKKRINPAYSYQFQQAIIYLLDKGIKSSDASTLKELMEDYRELKRIILETLSFDYKVEI